MGGHIPTLRGLIVEWAIMLGIATTLAATGPYGSFYIGSFADRLLYWLPATFGGYIIVRPVVVAAALVAQRLTLPLLPMLIGGVFTAALPITFFILWLNGNAFGRLPNFDGWLQLYLQIASIGAAITLLFQLIERRSVAPDTNTRPLAVTDPSPAISAYVEPTFLDRLPKHLGRDLLALEMEDHYVRAHTPHGNALILLRLRDAVAELAGADGMQVHRSWWVARGAVDRVIYEGRNIRLCLRGGLEAPVARNSVPALRAAGWLDRAG